MVRSMRLRRIREIGVGLRALGRGEDGLTLPELLVTMALLLVVMTAITGTLVSASQHEANLNQMVQSQTQARQALSKLTREIHCASVIQGSGGADMSTWTGPVSGITLNLPPGCPTGGAAAVTAKWCTVADGSTWDLYRLAATASDLTCPGAGGVRWASFLTTSTPFSVVSGTVATGHYPLVGVNLTMNASTSGKLSTYALSDDIAALNAKRS